VRDVSPSGLALYVNAALRPGSILLLKMENAAGWYSEPTLVRVRHVRALSTGCWLAGCSFTRKMNDEEFTRFLNDTQPLAVGKDAPTPTAADERRSNRVDSEHWLSVRIKAVSLLRPESLGRLLDMSEGGLGLVSVSAFPAGALLEVRLEQSLSAPWVPIRVKHCRPQERKWVLGCQYVGTPTPEQLAQFVQQ
jgi:hypothetical protein